MVIEKFDGTIRCWGHYGAVIQTATGCALQQTEDDATERVLLEESLIAMPMAMYDTYVVQAQPHELLVWTLLDATGWSGPVRPRRRIRYPEGSATPTDVCLMLSDCGGLLFAAVGDAAKIVRVYRCDSGEVIHKQRVPGPICQIVPFWRQLLVEIKGNQIVRMSW